jgi:hypothetical protein
MKMKRILSACFVTIVAQMFLHSVLADDLPKALSFARYEPILKHSPFAVATAAAAPTTADFARDLFIANAAHSPDGDWVALASSTDSNFRKYLTSQRGMDGYTLSNIEWSGRVGETKVTVGKDGQFATLSFNQALISQPLPRSPGGGVNAIAPVLGGEDMPANRIRPAPIPMLPTPPPRVRGVIPRNPLGGGYMRVPKPVTPQSAQQAVSAQPAEVPETKPEE